MPQSTLSVTHQAGGERVAVTYVERPYTACVCCFALSVAWSAGAASMASSVMQDNEHRSRGEMFAVVVASLFYLWTAGLPLAFGLEVFLARETVTVVDAPRKTIQWDSVYWIGNCLPRHCFSRNRAPTSGQLALSVIKTIDVRVVDVCVIGDNAGVQVVLGLDSERELLLAETCLENTNEATTLCDALRAICWPEKHQPLFQAA